MGNRSRYIAAAGIAVGAVGARRIVRRRRLGQAATDFVDMLMPSVAENAPASTMPVQADEAHAPGHQHLLIDERTAVEAEPSGAQSRPFTKRFHGLRHPGRQ